MSLDYEHEPVLQAFALAREIWGKARITDSRSDSGPLDLLERRNLGHVDDVVEFDCAPADNDLRVVVDAEVAHRMSERGARRHGQAENRDGKRDTAASSGPHRLPRPQRAPAPSVEARGQ